MSKPELQNNMQSQSQVSLLKAEVAALTKKLSEQQIAMLQMQQLHCTQITQTQQQHCAQMSQALDQVQKLTTEQIQTIQNCNDLKAQNQQLLDDRSKYDELKVQYHDILIQKENIEEESAKIQQQLTKIVAEQQQSIQHMQNNIVQMQNNIQQMRNSRQTWYDNTRYSLENIHYELSSFQQQIIQDHQELLRSILSQLRNSAQIQCYNSSQQPAQTYNNEFKVQQQIIYQINDNFVQHSNEQQQNTTEKQSEQEKEFRSSKDSQNDTQIIDANQQEQSKDSTSNKDINNNNETQLQPSCWIQSNNLSNNSSYAQDVQKFAHLIYGTNILSSGVTCKLCNNFIKCSNRISLLAIHIINTHSIDLYQQKYDYEQAKTTDNRKKAMDPENYIKDMEKYQLVKQYLEVDDSGNKTCKICRKCVGFKLKLHIIQIHNLVYNKEVQQFVENGNKKENVNTCQSGNYFVLKYYIKNHEDNFDVCRLCNQKIHIAGTGLYNHLTVYHQIDVDKQYNELTKSDSETEVVNQSRNYIKNKEFSLIYENFVKYDGGYPQCNICKKKINLQSFKMHLRDVHYFQYKQLYSSQLLTLQQKNEPTTQYKWAK